MKITGLFRTDHVNFNPLLPPSRRNPGGGVSTKILNLKAALPSIEIITDISFAGSVNITECLWFSDNVKDDSFESRVKRYQASKAFKILWVSDLQFAKWQGHEREEIFDASDIIAANSLYMHQLMKSFLSDVAFLTDPVDTNFIEPKPKKRQIVGISNIALEKNIESIIDIYSKMPKRLKLDRGYIGSADVWGLDIRNEVGSQLESELNTVCDWRASNVTRNQVKEALESSWAYIADTRYDTFCYGMVESMLAGCWCFCGKHLIYDERPVIRFDSTADAIQKISEVLDNGVTINEEMRQFVIDNYSLEKFRNQFINFMGGHFGF